MAHKIKGLMLMAQTPEEACNIVAIRRKKGINPRHNQLWFNFCNCASSGTHPIKDVVIVTPHTTGVLIAIVCIRKPLEGVRGDQNENMRKRAESRKTNVRVLSGNLP